MNRSHDSRSGMFHRPGRRNRYPTQDDHTHPRYRRRSCRNRCLVSRPSCALQVDGCKHLMSKHWLCTRCHHQCRSHSQSQLHKRRHRRPGTRDSPHLHKGRNTGHPKCIRIPRRMSRNRCNRWERPRRSGCRNHSPLPGARKLQLHRRHSCKGRCRSNRLSAQQQADGCRHPKSRHQPCIRSRRQYKLRSQMLGRNCHPHMPSTRGSQPRRTGPSTDRRPCNRTHRRRSRSHCSRSETSRRPDYRNRWAESGARKLPRGRHCLCTHRCLTSRQSGSPLEDEYRSLRSRHRPCTRCRRQYRPHGHAPGYNCRHRRPDNRDNPHLRKDRSTGQWLCTRIHRHMTRSRGNR